MKHDKTFQITDRPLPRRDYGGEDLRQAILTLRRDQCIEMDFSRANQSSTLRIAEREGIKITTRKLDGGKLGIWRAK